MVLIRPRELKVPRPQVDHLLYAGARVEHGGQKGIVPAAIISGGRRPSWRKNETVLEWLEKL